LIFISKICLIDDGIYMHYVAKSMISIVNQSWIL